MKKRPNGRTLKSVKRRTLLPGAGVRYEVGYGKPPVKTQFKKGTSGNPKGRFRRELFPEAPSDGIREALLARVVVLQGTRKRTMSAIEAILRKLVERALKGDDRAVMTVVKVAKVLGYIDEQPIADLDLSRLTDEELATMKAIYQKAKVVEPAE